MEQYLNIIIVLLYNTYDADSCHINGFYIPYLHLILAKNIVCAWIIQHLSRVNWLGMFSLQIFSRVFM